MAEKVSAWLDRLERTAIASKKAMRNHGKRGWPVRQRVERMTNHHLPKEVAQFIANCTPDRLLYLIEKARQG